MGKKFDGESDPYVNDVPSRCVDNGEAKGSFLPGHNNGTWFHRDVMIVYYGVKNGIWKGI